MTGSNRLGQGFGVGEIISPPGGSVLQVGEFVQVQTTGSELIFMRDGSTPGMRLDVRINGAVLRSFAPGQSIGADFSSIEICASANSAGGSYRLLAVAAPGMVRDAIVSHQFVTPVDLLGKMSDGLFSGSPIPVGTTPIDGTGNDSGVQIPVFGWNKIRACLMTSNDGSGGAPTFTGQNLTVIPWFGFPNQGSNPDYSQNVNGGMTWYQQLDASVSVSYLGTEMGAQVMSFDLRSMAGAFFGDGSVLNRTFFMFLEVQGADAGVASYDVCAQGIE